MLGSKNHFFRQEYYVLEGKWIFAYNLLIKKGYSKEKINVYKKAYDYFCLNPDDFDGATFVKDLEDISGLDLDAMLHDYQCIHFNVSSNLECLIKSNWLFYKGMIRKDKIKREAFVRLTGLTIIIPLFMIYSLFKRGFTTQQKKELFLKDYKLLIKKQ